MTDLIEGKLYRHVKTRGLYRLVLKEVTLEATMEPCVIYRSADDGRHWARPVSEFTDGRFELAEF